MEFIIFTENGNIQIPKRNLIKIFSNIFGVLGVITLIFFKIYQNGAIIVILFTFLCISIGASFGALHEYLLGKNKTQNDIKNK